MKARMQPRLRINLSGYTLPSPQWSWERKRPLVDYDLIIVTGGRGTYTGEGERWQVAAGSCMLLEPGCCYRGEQDPRALLSMVYLHFDFLDERGRVIRMNREELPPLHENVENGEFLQTLALNAKRGHERELQGEVEGEGEVWLRAALLELREKARRPRWQGFERLQAEDVERVGREIREKICEPWRMEDVAKRLGCSSDHAGRLFRKYLGVAPGEYVIRARVEAAKGLLNSSSLTVGQVAETLGYCDVYAFSRQFKLKVGMSPAAYRMRS